MNILVTNGSTRLSQTVAAALSPDHNVRLTDRGMVQTNLEFVRSDLAHDRSTNLLVRGMDAIMHSAEPDPGASASEQLDFAMRCTYNLLWAAWEERVRRVVLLSSLSVMGRYDEDYAVTERWRPVPTTDSRVLCFHLSEFVCREFAREKMVTVACLRMGDLVWDSPPGRVASSALYPDDAIQAVEKALNVDTRGSWESTANPWNLFHIQSALPNQRFLTRTAQEALGYSPSRRG